MARRVWPVLLSAITFGSLSGCSDFHREERPPWRAQAEEACLARGLVPESEFIRAAREMDGPGICGMTHPFKVTALAGGTVQLNSTATLDCPMIAALDGWIHDVVQPEAQARFGEPVVRINSMGSYSCRGINNMGGAKLSEHAFGNAIDVGGFVLASGRELTVMRGFNGADEQERAFLHDAHAGACSSFTTVLGPGYNIFHYNHFHLDLALHGSTSRGPRRYCKPVPEQALPEPPRHDALPDPPPVEEEMDIARAPMPAPSLGRAGPSFVASAPATLPSQAYTGAARRPTGMDPPSISRPRGVEKPQGAGAPSEPPDGENAVAETPVGTGSGQDHPALAPARSAPPPEASDAFDQAPDGTEGASAAQPRPHEGIPTDWDLTSSISR